MSINSDKIYDDFITDIDSVNTPADVERLRVNYLGREGRMTVLLRNIHLLNPEDRKTEGRDLNVVRSAIEKRIAELFAEFENSVDLEQDLDLTLPTRSYPINIGSIHPVTSIFHTISDILLGMGFSFVDGPDIEDEYHNFSALNTPESHPARGMSDSFYINEPEGSNGKIMLRTHTTTVQIRAMSGAKPPFRIFSFGRVYRKDWDATHTPMFHQVDGLFIESVENEEGNFNNMLSCLYSLLESVFDIGDLKFRCRPSFFPFTEPSAEIDIICGMKDGVFTVNHGDKWMEVLGCGMVHDSVLLNVGLDPDKFRGFAFGIGVERLAMLKYGIADLRKFFDSTLHWSAVYGNSPF